MQDSIFHILDDSDITEGLKLTSLSDFDIIEDSIFHILDDLDLTEGLKLTSLLDFDRIQDSIFDIREDLDSRMLFELINYFPGKLLYMRWLPVR